METGQEMMKALMVELHRRPGIRIFEETAIGELAVVDGEIKGALGLDLASGSLVIIEAKSVVLATGGIQAAFDPNSFHGSDLTGDGLALALRAGAELCDLEFMQFFPTALVWPPEVAGLIWVGELRYHCGAWLMNKHGERFMARYDPVRMELATRDLVARGVAVEILEGRGTPHGGVWMSVAHLARNQVQAFLDEWFPGQTFGGHDLRAAGIDVRTDALEVAPVAHFHMGGIRIDGQARTRVEGLFAAGEVAAGVHGANRIENNALTETQVFGAIAGEQAARYAAVTSRGSFAPDYWTRLQALNVWPIPSADGVSPSRVRSEMQRVLWERVGLVRNEIGLEQAVVDLTRLREETYARRVGGDAGQVLEEWETRNLVLVSEAIARAARARTESRGAHFRIDHPDQDNERWLSNLVVTLDDCEIRLQAEAVQFPYLGLTASGTLQASDVGT
jgi:succinate dehydrogenase/fumarate reductase flavoprotein subunit